MPFCRYCGDLVLKDRCRKCGGPPVAASFSWNPGKTNSSSQDRWKQTYTEKTPETPKVTPQQPPISISTGQSSAKPATTSVTPVRRFPRPLNNNSGTTQLNTRISAHISAATVERTPSHTRQGSYAEALADALDSSPSSNPILDDGVALSKVYGSVLQNPESLKTYKCADCGGVFTRDATLYPDPNDPTRILCRPCFMEAGGIQGECAACRKPVLRLKQEGQFVENSGKVWHSKCFVCDGCAKNIAASPSVDLYGRPCCHDCFDTCLSRPLGSKTSTPRQDDRRKSGTFESNEASPVVEELSRRLRIQDRETSTSPTRTRPRASNSIPGSGKEELAVALDSARRFTEKLQTNETSLSTKQREVEDLSNSPSPKEKQRRQSIHSTNEETKRSSSTWNEPPSQHMKTPDLTSDASDDTESLVASPETPRAEAPADDLDALCDSCSKPLFSINGGGKIVTVPAESGYPGRYHSTCFVCSICQEPFSEKHGTAAFVVIDKGLAHLSCAPALKPKIVTRQRPVSMLPILRPEEEPTPVQRQSTVPRPTSALSTATMTPPAFLVAPNKNRCAGCEKMVAVMEPGVVPGPNGSRWHASCLVCGGKGVRKRSGEPGCGKKLDRDAKLDPEGKTWCSSCMTLLILNGNVASASTRTPVSATFSGAAPWLPTHHTGASSVSSHATGSSTSTIQDAPYSRPRSITAARSTASEAALGMLNARNGSISPTKGMLGGTVPVNRSLSTKRASRPRPKSVSVLPMLGLSANRTGRMDLLQETASESILQRSPAEKDA